MTHLTPLPRSFYARDVLEVAPECIGKLLVHDAPDGLVAGRIVECEAYRGPEDRAAHSFGGRRTARTEPMFGPPGTVYMFRLYGSSWAVNLVTGEVDQPQAVLLRALCPVHGIDRMSARRGFAPNRREISNGPGKLCRALDIDGRFNQADLTSGILFVANGIQSDVGCSPRINIDYAGAWVEKPWRFYERGCRYVSVPPRI